MRGNNYCSNGHLLTVATQSPSGQCRLCNRESSRRYRRRIRAKPARPPAGPLWRMLEALGYLDPNHPINKH